jgi:hypothetical protein
MMEELEDTKGDRQHNGQKKKDNAMSLNIPFCIKMLSFYEEHISSKIQ